MNVTFNTKERQVKSIIEQIEKQQMAVGSYVQEIILKKRQESGKDLIVRDYMESQRLYCWETWRASNLIQSLLLGISIPEIVEYRHDDKSQFRKILDGQQRLTSVYLCVTNQFKLDLTKSIFPTFEIEDQQYTYQDIQGKTFSELPQLFQDIILDRDMRLTTINNCSDEQAEKIYVSMNTGFKALKAVEVRAAAMGLNTRKFFASVLDSDWVKHVMTEKASKSNIGSEIMSQVITLLYNKELIELNKENIDKVIYSFRDGGVPEELQNNIADICNYLNETTSIWIENKKRQDSEKVIKRGKGVANYSTYRFTCFNKTSIVMLMISANTAIKNNVPVETFANWSLKFFSDPSEDYKKGLVDKAIEVKMLEFRLIAIEKEIGKLGKDELKVNGEAEIIEKQEELRCDTQEAQDAQDVPNQAQNELDVQEQEIA